MPVNTCPRHIKGKVIRMTGLQSTGRTNSGASASVVINAFTKMTLTPVYAETGEIEEINADGDLCLAVPPQRKLKRVDWELLVCDANPYLHALAAGGETIAVPGGGVGYGFPDIGEDPLPNGVSIEIWARAVDEGGAPDPTFTYAWYVVPRAYGAVGAKTFQAGPQDASFSGHAIENPGWYDGPQNDHPAPTKTYKVVSWVPTNSAPTASCGYTAGLSS